MKIIWQSSGLIQLFKNTCIIIAFLQWRCWIKKTHTTAADESRFHVCTDVCTDVGTALDSFSYCKRQFKHRYESVYLLYLIPVSIKPVSLRGNGIRCYCWADLFVRNQIYVKAFDRTCTLLWKSSADFGQFLLDWHILTLFAQGLAMDDWLPLIYPGKSES